MIERTYETPSGMICYWGNKIDVDAVTLVFLPGVWDASGHAASWPFKFDFELVKMVI